MQCYIADIRRKTIQGSQNLQDAEPKPIGMICRDLQGFIWIVGIGSITMTSIYNIHRIGEHVMANQAVRSPATGPDTKVKDALDHVRAAAQELHGAISDAVAKRGGATKADLEAFAQKAKAVAESAKSSISGQTETAKKSLQDAVSKLEATQRHAAEGLKTSGQAFQTSIKQVLADARGSVQKVSEAIAAKRSAAAKK